MTLRVAASLILLSLLTVDGASAQQRRGQADLRYTAPMPAKVSYLSVDSMQMSTGLPSGALDINARLRSVVDIDITPAANGVRMVAMLKEFNGSMETPMGDMPFPGGPAAGTSTEFNVGIKGMNLKQSFDDAERAGIANLDVNSIMGRSREIAPLLVLPGKVVTLQETWTDTISLNDTIQGMRVTMLGIIRGTYERDTVVAGRTLNILVFRNEMNMTSAGMVQGREMQQTMKSTSIENVLWDSSQHLLISNHVLSELKLDMVMAEMGNMTMTGKVKAVKLKMD